MSTTAREEHVRTLVTEWWQRQVHDTPYYADTMTLEDLTRYVLRVDAGIDTARPEHQQIARWLTERCPECGALVAEMGEPERSAHLVVSGFVVVCCEWYWTVSPAAVGVANPWCDWQEDVTPVQVSDWIRTGHWGDR